MFSWPSKSSASGAPAERRDPLMGTVVHQRVYGIGGAASCQQARDEIARLEHLWSMFRADSELSELARGAGGPAQRVDVDTAALLMQTLALHAMTQGAVDITVGPLVELWRAAARSGNVPSAEQLAAACALVGMEDVEFVAGRSVRLKRVGQRLDLGAIGKGYAADRCIELYRQHGHRHALIDLGGNVAMLGGRPNHAPWRVGVQAPTRSRGECIGYVEARDCSIATSGSYERSFQVGERRFSHILDPRTGWPIAHDALSVTIMHASATYADALATACVVLGPERGFELARSLELDALFVDASGQRLTPGMAQVFHAF